MNRFSLLLGFGLSLSITLASCNTKPPIRTVHRFGDTALQENRNGETTNNTNTLSEAQIKLSDQELHRYAYELGYDPRKQLSSSEVQDVENRKTLRQLERSLDSQKERLSYSKVVPWLNTDLEKIEYLSIPSLEGRHAWVRKNKVWLRAKNQNFHDLIEDQDISVGMTTDLVKKSWGQPDSVEYSGNPIYKNERWKYNRQVPSQNGYHHEKRYIFFEGGKVVGWETE